MTWRAGAPVTAVCTAVTDPGDVRFAGGAVVSAAKGGVMAFQRVCSADALAVGTMAHFGLGDRSVLYHLDDGWYATQRRGSHTMAASARARVGDGAVHVDV